MQILREIKIIENPHLNMYSLSCIHSRRRSYFVEKSKQTIVASSMMYAEFIACYKATGQTLWLKKFIPDLKVVDCIDKPLKMYRDNQPAIFYAHNNKSSTGI
jgi:hypothetical protein